MCLGIPAQLLAGDAGHFIAVRPGTTADGLADLLATSLRRPGPFLIELLI